MDSEFLRHIVFWSIWLFMPIVFDVAVGIYRAIKAAILNSRNKKNSEIEFEHKSLVSVIIPVYNSEKCLRKCVDSIIRQSYGVDNLEILLVDNGSTDLSYKVFQEMQNENKKLKMWWYKSGKGKAKALNTGLYYANGKYIINIDSDGYLNNECIANIVYKFECDREISAITGGVVIDSEGIKKTKGIFGRVIAKCEFTEYAEMFSIGRNSQDKNNDIFTMAGAISAIRCEVAAKSQMYNSTTIGEDTHMTQQIILLQNGVVAYCKDAIFYTDPIESVNKLSVQRQRWQRGSLEVASMFNEKRKENKKTSILKMLVSDHTLTFPKFIWVFAIFYLAIIGYPMSMIIATNIIIYIAYVILSLVSMICSAFILRDSKEIKKYILANILICMLMPMYRGLILLFRISGIINSLSSESKWNGRGMIEEFRLGIKAIFFIKEKQVEECGREANEK